MGADAQQIGHEMGVVVRRKRKQLGMSQRVLAGLLGIDVARISEIERGTLPRSPQRMIDLARNLNCHVSSLFGEETSRMEGELKMSFEEAMTKLKAAEHAAVFELGKRMGFAHLMYAASRLWQGMGDNKFALSVGPPVVECIPCPHQGVEKAADCNWCCGAGWVTKRVLKAQMTHAELSKKGAGRRRRNAGGKKKKSGGKRS